MMTLRYLAVLVILIAAVTSVGAQPTPPAAFPPLVAMDEARAHGVEAGEGAAAGDGGGG